MKFAHDFKVSLATQDFPPHWVDKAIPYGQLKKCLKQVQSELHDLGLDPETLRALLDPDDAESPVALHYRLNASSNSSILRPKLTVNIHLRSGVPVNATLTPTSRNFLEKIAADLPPEFKLPIADNAAEKKPVAEAAGTHTPPQEHTEFTRTGASLTAQEVTVPRQVENETVEVPLVFDSRFFDMLQSDVSSLDDLQTREEENIVTDIVALGKDVAKVSKPSRFSKNDLTSWRRIFELYLDAQVFFATNEQDHGARSSQVALKQLKWFQNEVESRHLAQAFKLPQSRAAFNRFLSLNVTLLKNLQFQELNRLAITKILKKFDKRTSLGVSKTFPGAVHRGKLLAGSLARDVCAQMSKELTGVVPQVNDYLCPICFTVAYLPVRLECQHVFCISCVVSIQKRKEKHCPLCRAPVVLKATADDVDYKLKKYMKKYFKEEVKEKQRADGQEYMRDNFGSLYKENDCNVM